MGIFKIVARLLSNNAERQKEGNMTEHNEFDDYAADYEVVEPEHPEAQPEPEALLSDTRKSKPEWSLGRNGSVGYGDSGPEVDYINAVFGVDAASFTKATEDAVAEYRARLNGTRANFVGYHTYKTL